MHTVVTIGRQHGSGGSRIGRLLAERRGYRYYDRDSLRELALENGLEQLLTDCYGERHASSLLFSLITGDCSFGYYDASRDSPISKKALLLAFDTIRDAVRQNSCVIVGRCADFVLRDHPNCFSTFIHAPVQVRVRSVAQAEGITTEEAMEQVIKVDRMRRSYYNYYTTKNWGDVDSYHMTFDSSMLGIEQTVQLLDQIVTAREEMLTQDDQQHFSA